MPSNTPAPPSSNSISQDLIDSVFEPGVNRGLYLALNASFIALLFTLTFLAVASEGNFHVVLLLVITLALYGSILILVVVVAQPVSCGCITISQFDH
ncbi:hypothetical protein H4R33_000305 [Dimargaris cristalligena]|nr:hypothetical protein H4R33_000305 [Dimargaris cristalligena]